MLSDIQWCRLALCRLRNQNDDRRLTWILIARPCVPGDLCSGAQRPGILDGWICEMANDDRVEGVVAQTHTRVAVGLDEILVAR
jgi:hypothetical protein